MPAIQPITDELLITAIRRASQRVVLISPGVWPPVAAAVAAAWERLGRDKVTVILDVDPEICRIGYGSLEGMQILQNVAAKLGEALGQEPGIRICVFIVDQETFVFSPTPCQLEAPPGGSSPVSPSQPKANGIVLSRPPEKLADELGCGIEDITQRKLGLEPLSQEKLKEVTEDLAKNPPKNFNLTQLVNVYNARVQFVEFKLSGCQLSEHKAQIPAHLIQVLKRNPVLSKKIGKTIKLIDEDDELVTDPNLSQTTLFEHREKIDDRYLHSVKGVGTVIEREKKTEFSKKVESLKAEVEKFAKSVEAKLAERFQQTAEQLADEILDEVLADLPERWRKKLGMRPDPQRVRWHVLEDLLKAFGTPAGKVGKMKVDTVFKDVTYDMLNDPEFRAQMAEYFTDLDLMEEFKAAKERPATTQATPNDLF